MMDAMQAIYEVLSASSELADVGDQHFTVLSYGGALPEHTDPTSQPTVVFSVRGGTTHPEIPLIEPSIQVVSWAGINQFKLARQTYGAVRETLHGLANVTTTAGRIVTCVEEMPGQDVTDPDTGWATVISFYKLILVDA